jgi:hypothetical protein
MTDVRDHLIYQMEVLRDAPRDQLDSEIERAKAMAGIASQLIDSAKVEVQFMQARDDAEPTGFLPTLEQVVKPRLVGRG